MVMRLHRKKCEAIPADIKDKEPEFRTTSFKSRFHKDSKHQVKDYNKTQHDWQWFQKEYTTFNSNGEKEIEKVNTLNGLVK